VLVLPARGDTTIRSNLWFLRLATAFLVEHLQTR